MRVLNKDTYTSVFFEASSQAELLIEIGFHVLREDSLIEAINLDYDWESDKPYLAIVVISR